MILYDFRYQDPGAEEIFVLPNFIEQTQALQRQDQQAEINRQTLDKLLNKLSLKDIVGLDHAKARSARLLVGSTPFSSKNTHSDSTSRAMERAS